MGSSIWHVRRISVVLLAGHRCHGRRHRESSYRHTCHIHRCLLQNGQNQVFDFLSLVLLLTLTSELPALRFGETLPMVDNVLKIEPFETSQRHLRTISDYATYKKLHATLPAAVLAGLKARIRSGEPRAVRDLWDKRDKAFLAIDFECSERNSSAVLEWGYAAVRCGHLDALVHHHDHFADLSPHIRSHRLSSWPPVPEDNYRSVLYASDTLNLP